MSYFSISDFIKSGKQSLDDKNYYSALSVALMLPSMCSRIACETEKDKYMNFKWNDKNDHSKGKTYTDWKDKDCYIDWCNLYMKGDLWMSQCLGQNYAEILYQLRCDIVHAGCANIYADHKSVYLALGKFQCSAEFTKYKVIPVKDLCEMIFGHVDSWCTTTGATGFKYTYVFDTENSRDDKLLYSRLCDNDRADYLQEQFEREHSEGDENNG